MNLRQLDEKYLSRSSDPENIEVIKTKGSFIYDAKGKKYIDFTMGWCVGNVGWNNDEIRRKLKSFNGPEYVTPHHLYKSWVELARQLAQITPGKLQKSFRATGGTEAVELALQAAISHTRRHKFISIEGAYHGDSIAARSVGSPDFGRWHPLFPCYRLSPPLDEACADSAEKWLKNRDIAAVIMEPVICNLGVLIPEQKFMERIQELCKKYGTLFIVDEVATGFGRTGKMFASEHFNLEPDILCVAKAITAGFAPLGATITTEEVAKSMMSHETGYYSTYGWHPRSVDAALATIQFLLKHQERLESNTLDMGAYFSERLNQMNFKGKVEINVMGLAIGVHLKNKNYGEDIVEKARRRELLLSESDSGFTMFPALDIDFKTAKAGLDIIEDCI
ncbi:class-III pyridoxal-phosphate-dependent aminotransferase [Bdellovibrio reynosensis]|uniref:Aspartate aminotransferase family protein n=1 Tax=Bdellovibrio reynosensis TaxID=2835041 RepID=A0ABY4C859_9BACT|nr:aspartate aminotransferase family protein [Bdellovibrio reynosensis]UOF00659.1 aspartate aminotransferase family protein [Bdellovibrio reynosensis]